MLIWGSASRALYAYRAGNAEGAIDWAQKCIEISVNDEQRALVLAVQSLSQQKLGQSDAARESLAQATALIDAALTEFRRNPQLLDWQDWLIADILRREAVATVSSPVEKGKDAEGNDSAKDVLRRE